MSKDITVEIDNEATPIIFKCQNRNSDLNSCTHFMRRGERGIFYTHVGYNSLPDSIFIYLNVGAISINRFQFEKNLLFDFDVIFVG